VNEIIDSGIILDLRAHGENHAIVNVLSAVHGRVAGFLFGGQGRRQQPNVQPGNNVNFTLTHKILSQLGTLQLELIHNPSVDVLHDPTRLTALQFLCPLLARMLPEYHPYPNLFAAAAHFFQDFSASDWAEQYVMLELRLLAELGYGLDFTRCAMTGERDVTQLAYVSPKTGRAATAAASAGYERNLFPLPKFMVAHTTADAADIRAGLQLTGYFLERHMEGWQYQALLQVRARLINHFQTQLAA